MLKVMCYSYSSTYRPLLYCASRCRQIPPVSCAELVMRHQALFRAIWAISTGTIVPEPWPKIDPTLTHPQVSPESPLSRSSSTGNPWSSASLWATSRLATVAKYTCISKRLHLTNGLLLERGMPWMEVWCSSCTLGETETVRSARLSSWLD